MKSVSIGFSLLLFFAVSCVAQQADPPPGGMKLLPGYSHKTEQGIDSRVGRIWKENGLNIEYDIGELAGNYAECSGCGWTDGAVWKKKQVVNGESIVCVFTKEKRLVVSFPKSHANFYATITTEDQLTDMLLMVLTFDGKLRS